MTRDEFFSSHSKLTRSLRKFIADQEARIDAEIFQQFLDHLHEELLRYRAELDSLESSEEKARRLHERIDQEMISGSDVPVSCQKGCSACCYMEVEITNFEASILSNKIKAGFSIDSDRLKIQSQRKVQDPLWSQSIREPNNRCVFLDDEGSCGIYVDRPSMCRRHSVSSPKENCESQYDSSIVIRYFPRVDAWISAANEDSQLEVGPLAKMLSMKLFP